MQSPLLKERNENLSNFNYKFGKYPIENDYQEQLLALTQQLALLVERISEIQTIIKDSLFFQVVLQNLKDLSGNDTAAPKTVITLIDYIFNKLELASRSPFLSRSPENKIILELIDNPNVKEYLLLLKQRKQLLDKIKNIQADIEYCRSDQGDLEDLVKELGYRLEEGYSPQENIVSQIHDDNLQQGFDEVRDPSALMEIEDIKDEVLVHTTKHFERILILGGIATRSHIHKHDETTFNILSENGFNKEDKDLNKSSPMNGTDNDAIFFGSNSIHHYGSIIIAYKATDLLVNTNLFYQRNPIAAGEVAISDIHCQSSNSLLTANKSIVDPNYDKSDLKIGLKNAFIYVPRLSFKNICRKLLEYGYSPRWILERVHSYRGDSAESSKDILDDARSFFRSLNSEQTPSYQIKRNSSLNENKANPVNQIFTK